MLLAMCSEFKAHRMKALNIVSILHPGLKLHLIWTSAAYFDFLFLWRPTYRVEPKKEALTFKNLFPSSSDIDSDFSNLYENDTKKYRKFLHIFQKQMYIRMMKISTLGAILIFVSLWKDEKILYLKPWQFETFITSPYTATYISWYIVSVFHIYISSLT